MKWYMNSVDDCSLPWHLLSILCKDLRATAPWHLPVGLSGVSVVALNSTGPLELEFSEISLVRNITRTQEANDWI